MEYKRRITKFIDKLQSYGSKIFTSIWTCKCSNILILSYSKIVYFGHCNLCGMARYSTDNYLTITAFIDDIYADNTIFAKLHIKKLYFIKCLTFLKLRSINIFIRPYTILCVLHKLLWKHKCIKGFKYGLYGCTRHILSVNNCVKFIL